ncbi:hypothetical protein A4X03_0g5351 [Tilletia caries]|uniref:Reverse transcriptase RNase H-like domain-containing protein n=1 Tax=Tilletia caries TaxID=13290 RepID=A0A8T8T6M8_9BASI|nr:hypothetical protein A4X03_0g5351 [Tilletia caries]
MKHWHLDAIDTATRTGCTNFNKTELLAALNSIRSKTMKVNTIKSGFRLTGIHPFNPDMVLVKFPETTEDLPVTLPSSPHFPSDVPTTPKTVRTLSRVFHDIEEQHGTDLSPTVLKCIRGGLIQAQARSDRQFGGVGNALPDGRTKGTEQAHRATKEGSLDLLPRQTDPFADDRESPPSAIEVPSVVDALPPSPPSGLLPRSGEPLSTSSSSPPLPVVSPPPSPSVVAARRRLSPPALRDFQLGIVQHPAASELDNALRGPLGRPRRMVVDGREVLLVERPVAYLSRLTNPAEKKQVASELELSCLAWAFAKFAHLLEGAEVTIITDHEPMDKMLTSTANITYGPAISRCRAILMPHLSNFRFQYRPGSRHVNVDALSRLVPGSGQPASGGGDVVDSPLL